MPTVKHDEATSPRAINQTRADVWDHAGRLRELEDRTWKLLASLDKIADTLTLIAKRLDTIEAGIEP